MDEVVGMSPEAVLDRESFRIAQVGIKEAKRQGPMGAGAGSTGNDNEERPSTLGTKEVRRLEKLDSPETRAVEAEKFLARLDLMAGSSDPGRKFMYEMRDVEFLAEGLPWKLRNETLGAKDAMEAVGGMFALWSAAKGKLKDMVSEQFGYPSMPDMGKYFSHEGVGDAVQAYMRSGEIIKHVEIDSGAKLEPFPATSLWAEAQLEGQSAAALRRAVSNEVLLKMAEKRGLVKGEQIELLYVGEANPPQDVQQIIARIWRWNRGDMSADRDLDLLVWSGERSPSKEEDRVGLTLDERMLRIDKDLENIVVGLLGNTPELESLRMDAAIAEMKARKLCTIWGEFNSYDPALRTGGNDLSDFMWLGYWMRKRRGSQGAGPLMTNGLLFGWEPTKTVAGKDKTPLEPIVNTGFYAAGDGVGSFTLFARDDSGRTLRELIKSGAEIDWGRFAAEAMRSWTTLIRVQKALPDGQGGYDGGFVDSKFIKITAKLEDVSTEKWMESVGYMGALLMVLSPVTGTMRAFLDRDIREGKLAASSPLKGLKDDEVEASRYKFGATGEVYDSATGRFLNKESGQWIKPENPPKIDKFKSEPRYRLAQDGKIWDMVLGKYLDRDMATWVSAATPNPDSLKTYNQIKHAFRMAAFIALVAANVGEDFSPTSLNPITNRGIGSQMMSVVSVRGKLGVSGEFINKEEAFKGGINEQEWNDLPKIGRQV